MVKRLYGSSAGTPAAPSPLDMEAYSAQQQEANPPADQLALPVAHIVQVRPISPELGVQLKAAAMKQHEEALADAATGAIETRSGETGIIQVARPVGSIAAMKVASPSVASQFEGLDASMRVGFATRDKTKDA